MNSRFPNMEAKPHCWPAWQKHAVCQSHLPSLLKPISELWLHCGKIKKSNGRCWKTKNFVGTCCRSLGLAKIWDTTTDINGAITITASLGQAGTQHKSPCMWTSSASVLYHSLSVQARSSPPEVRSKHKKIITKESSSNRQRNRCSHDIMQTQYHKHLPFHVAQYQWFSVSGLQAFGM